MNTGSNRSFRGFVNAHFHSDILPYKGLTTSAPFEVWFSFALTAGGEGMTPEEHAACALVVGIESLKAGNVALIDHPYIALTEEHVYGVAEAYESLGIRAWVFPNLEDMPMTCYTSEAYPKFSKAVSTEELPEETRPAVILPPSQEQLSAVEQLIRGWKGNRVKMGLAINDPVSSSDGLLEGAFQLVRELGCPLEVHAEESPAQREMSLAQSGCSGVQRLDHFGLLSPNTIVAHSVQASDEDIQILAQRGASVAHNPISNMKLQNGIAPVGKMLKAGVNVCLGTDGPDDLSLSTTLRFATGLARLNGLQQATDDLEEQVIEMATSNGYKLFPSEDIAGDRVEYQRPVDPVNLVWSDMSSYIDEVYIDGKPVLKNAVEVVEKRRAYETVASVAAKVFTPEQVALIEKCEPLLRRYAISK